MAHSNSSLSAVKHVFKEPLLKGRLLKRYKRFLAEVVLDNGQQVICHCPNSGSMLGCASPGALVGVSYHVDPKRKTAYTWQMVKVDKTWVGINTALSNPIVLQAAQKNMPPFFTDAIEARPEIKINQHTRLDMLVHTPQGKLYVEVKNVTLLQGRQAMFPDAITTRGQKHLRELAELKKAGHRALIVYLVQRSDAENFVPAWHIDPDYGREFVQAVDNGVEVLVWQAKVGLKQISLWRQLPWQANF